MDVDAAPAPKLNEQSDIKATASKIVKLVEENVKLDEEGACASLHCFVTSQNCGENPSGQNATIAIDSNSAGNRNVNEDKIASRFEQIIDKLPQDDEVSATQNRNKTNKDAKENISFNLCINYDGEKQSKGRTADDIRAAIDRLELDDIKHHTLKTDNVSTEYANTRFLEKDATTYKLETFSKNKMLIFNQINCPGEMERVGSHKDVEALEDCFQERAFEVVPFDDCTKHELFEKLRKVICQDMSDYGCFAVAILTHGSDGGLLMTKQGKFYESELVDALTASNAPSLLTKPKLLIIQACRGNDMSRAAPVGQMPTGVNVKYDSPSIKSCAYTVAAESDFLIINSTFPGMKAHRSEELGTWFIQSLCKFIKKSEPSEDMWAILTRLKWDISINHSGVTADDKQVPVVTTTLTRTLYLNSGVKKTALSMISKNTSKPIETEEQSEEVEASSNEKANNSKTEELELKDNDYVVDRDFVDNGIQFWEGDVISSVKCISESWRFGVFMRTNRWLPERLFTCKDGETPDVRPWQEVTWHVSNYCRAKFEYRPMTPGHLTLRPGDLIAVLKKNVKGSDWWSGRKRNGKTGIFPRSLVFLLDPKSYNCSREMCGENWNGSSADTQQWYKDILDMHGPTSRAVAPVKSQLCPNCLNYILELEN